MNRLLRLLQKIYLPVLFLILWIPAIAFYARSTSYTKAKLLTMSNKMLGGINGGVRSVGDYFLLSRTNKQLTGRIEELENALAATKEAVNQEYVVDESIAPYAYQRAKIVTNSNSLSNNFFTIDRGQIDGVQADMAVINIDGSVAGYVVNTSERFATCMSILNTKFNTGGKIKNREYFGSIKWDGSDSRYVTLSDISRFSEVVKGDTIATTLSFRFPPNLTIGTVEDFWLDQNGTNYIIKVRLSNETAKMRNVLVIKYTDQQELFGITNPTDSLNN